MKKLLLLALLLPRLVWAVCSTDTYSAVICLDNPAHYYRLAEPSGTTAADIGSAVVNGTYTGGYTLAQTGIPAITNKAVALTGGATDGYVLMNPAGNGFYPPNGNGAGWSYEEWIYPTTTGTTMGIMGGSDSASSANSRANSLILSGGAVRFRVYNTSGSCSGTYGNIESSAITANNWHHVVGTTLGSGGALSAQSLYIDGVLSSTISSFSGSICTASPIFTFGTSPAFIGGGANSLQGRLDEAALYIDTGDGSGQLSAAKVLAHYNAGISTSFTTGGWPFITRRPEIPNFRDNNYMDVLVRDGYNTGLFAPRALIPQFFTLGYVPFNAVPRGNTSKLR